MTKIKICGITCLEDAKAAANAGAHALGFVFCESPRRVSPEAAAAIVSELPETVLTVGVFLDDSVDHVESASAISGVAAVQLHGRESVEDCELLMQSTRTGHVIKRFNVKGDDDRRTIETRMAPYRVSARLLDPGAGSGHAFRWEVAQGLAGPLIVAGGLDPDNVGIAIRAARPYAVDVCSGVEQSPGRKCPDRLRAFIRAVRESQAGERTDDAVS